MGLASKSRLCLAAVALTTSLAFVFLGMRLTSGHWVYTLDDAYIHMAMARTLAEHGVWGVAPSEATFCSSSPLWTLLLAFGFKVLGVHDWLPGVLNIGCLLLALLVADDEMRKACVEAKLRVAAGLVLLFLAPLTVIVSTGMEHTLHVLLMLLFLGVSLRVLRQGGSFRDRTMLLLLAFLSTGARYESLFVIVPVALLVAQRKAWTTAFLLLAVGILPVVVHGAFAHAFGGFFLPNSLMLKGHFPSGGLASWVTQAFSMYLRVSMENVHLHLLCLLLLGTACCGRVVREVRLLALALVAASVVHLTISECGRFYRYEIYLMALGLVVLAVAWLPLLKVPSWGGLVACVGRADREIVLARCALVIFFVLPLVLRGGWASGRIVRASANIYEQQEQLAQIFRAYPDMQETALAVNDLGLMAYRSGAKLIDLWGVGTTEVSRLKVQHRYDKRAISELLDKHRVGYVVVFDQWFARGRELPDDLVLVAKLSIKKDIVCFQDTVMIYATSQSGAGRLAAFLSHLPFRLPSGSRVEIVHRSE